MERRDFLKILLVGGLGIAAGKACSVIDKSIDPGSTPIPTETPLPTDIPRKEEIVPYGQYWIGESGVGAITDLELQTNPDQRFVDEVKNRVFQIPEFKDKNIGVHVYDMVGETGKAPFVLVSENNEKGEAQKAYVAFWVDEKGVQRPPVDGKIYALYPLLIEPQDNGTVLIGIPDIMNLGMQLPELFFIDNQKNVFFFPPYTDKKSPDSPGGGIKVQAIPVEMFVPEAPSLPENDLDIIPSSIESVDVVFMGVHIKGAFAKDKNTNYMDKVIISDESHAKFLLETVHKVWLVRGGVDGTGPETKLTLEEYAALWAKAQETNDPNDWRAVQFTMTLNIRDDGNGFTPKRVIVWPMSNAQAPEGTVSFDQLIVPIVDVSKIKNVARDSVYGAGYGPNLQLSEGTLYLYLGLGQSKDKYALLTLISLLNKLVIRYHGTDTFEIFASHDIGLYNFLKAEMEVVNQ